MDALDIAIVLLGMAIVALMLGAVWVRQRVKANRQHEIRSTAPQPGSNQPDPGHGRPAGPGAESGSVPARGRPSPADPTGEAQSRGTDAPPPASDKGAGGG